MLPTKPTLKTQQAIKRYGEDRCKRAFALNDRAGEGPSTIAAFLGLSGTQAANAAIDAGREINERSSRQNEANERNRVDKKCGHIGVQLRTLPHAFIRTVCDVLVYRVNANAWIVGDTHELNINAKFNTFEEAVSAVFKVSETSSL